MGFDLYGIKPTLSDKTDELKAVNKEIDQYLTTQQPAPQELWHKKFELENTIPGAYFRRNVWGWRPLWDYVIHACDDVLTIRDAYAGGYNDGHRISKAKALRIAKRLEGLIAEGKVKEYVQKRKDELAKMPDETCNLCSGTGTRNDAIVQGTCNGCQGKGTKRPIDTWYDLDETDVLEFAEFAKHSGGFKIY